MRVWVVEQVGRRKSQIGTTLRHQSNVFRWPLTVAGVNHTKVPICQRAISPPLPSYSLFRTRLIHRRTLQGQFRRFALVPF